MSLSGKEFMLTHHFKDVSSMKKDEPVPSPLTERFGIFWNLETMRIGDDLGAFIHCSLPKQNHPWEINVEIQFEVLTSKGKAKRPLVPYKFALTENSGFGTRVLSWDPLEKEYLVEDSIQLIGYVKIIKATGIQKQKLLDFSTPHPNHTDGALIVEGQSFHICKRFLARTSSVFRRLFFGNYTDPNKKEFELDGITADEMQNFLEQVYDEDVINDDTVGGILKVAKQFNWESCIGGCVDFLIEESDKSYKEKLAIAAKYQSEELRDHCIMRLNTKDAIKAALPNDIYDMDPTAAKLLLQKSLYLE